jgi:6-methylsalicylate decarboxylase
MTEHAAYCDEARLIDLHAHFVTDAYVGAARAAGVDYPDGMPGWPSWSADEHLRLMDAWGVERSIMSISSPGTHFGDDAAARVLTRQVNDDGAKIVRDHPGRFGHFASLPLPDVDGALAELARALDDLGSDGVAVESNKEGIYLGDARLVPLYEELNRRRAIIFVHPTSPPCADELALGRPRPMLEFIFDSARTVSDLVFTDTLLRYPDIQWVFTHCGGTLPLLADRMQLFNTALFGGSGPSVPEQASRLWFDIAGTPFPNQVPALVAAFGSERVLYGSDYCWTPPSAVSAQLASVAAANQPDGGTWRDLTTRNAERLLGRPRA